MIRSQVLSRPFRPFLKKIPVDIDLFALYRSLRRKGGASVFLESARVSERSGRYSFLLTDPFLTFECAGPKITLKELGNVRTVKGDPFEILQKLLRRYSYPVRSGQPAFLGGAVGYIGYEAKSFIEPKASFFKKPGLGLPDLYFLFFDQGILRDHKKNETYIFANAAGMKNKKSAAGEILKKIRTPEKTVKPFSKREEILPANSKSGSLKNKIRSSFTRRRFNQAVDKAKGYIKEGDIYQANLAQRLDFMCSKDPLDIYEDLRRLNPSSFFGFLDAGKFQILSGSPERLVKLEKGALETRPIAGTRSRGRTMLRDKALSRELLLSEKERAEHIMLVDLERNDMGRVAEYGSVAVDELMVLEDYSHVKHIVSNVKGRLRKGFDAVDVIRSFFPGGTITGAPKVRSMEIIDELEPVGRGPYTGSLGYFGFNGNADFNIIIRSLVFKKKKAYLEVGAGIVADSVPDKEYDETLYKAEGVLASVFGPEQAARFLRQRGVADRVS